MADTNIKKPVQFDFYSEQPDDVSQISNETIAFIEESRKVRTHGTDYKFASWKKLSKN